MIEITIKNKFIGFDNEHLLKWFYSVPMVKSYDKYMVNNGFFVPQGKSKMVKQPIEVIKHGAYSPKDRNIDNQFDDSEEEYAKWLARGLRDICNISDVELKRYKNAGN